MVIIVIVVKRRLKVGQIRWQVHSESIFIIFRIVWADNHATSTKLVLAGQSCASYILLYFKLSCTVKLCLYTFDQIEILNVFGVSTICFSS